MVVIITGCALFVTSHCDIKFIYPTFWQSLLTQCISLHMHSPYSLLYLNILAAGIIWLYIKQFSVVLPIA